MKVRDRRQMNVSVVGALALVGSFLFSASALASDSHWHQQTVSFLGTTLDRNHQPAGVVAKLNIEFRIREEQKIMNVSFASVPGKFSPLTQVAVQEGIKASALAAGLDPRTWDIFLSVPYQGVRIFGESLSAMVSLAVLAMANHHPILADRIITGKITRDGRIGAVGGIPLKIQAAHAEHFQRVVIPDDRYQEDDEWETPFLMHISPVRTVLKAYQILTGHVLVGQARHDQSRG